jgi:hypothetical protein
VRSIGTDYQSRSAAVLFIAEAQLAIAAIAPRVDLARAGECHGVIPATRHVRHCHVLQRTDQHWTELIAWFGLLRRFVRRFARCEGRSGTVDRCQSVIVVQTQPTIGIASPAEHFAIFGQCEHVTASTGELNHVVSMQSGDQFERELKLELVVAESELAIVIAPARVHCSVLCAPVSQGLGLLAHTTYRAAIESGRCPPLQARIDASAAL